MKETAVKRIILIVDILLMFITAILLFYYDKSGSYGLAALEDVGKVVVCLIGLGIELIILLILIVVWLYKRLKK